MKYAALLLLASSAMAQDPIIGPAATQSLDNSSYIYPLGVQTGKVRRSSTSWAVAGMTTPPTPVALNDPPPGNGGGALTPEPPDEWEPIPGDWLIPLAIDVAPWTTTAGDPQRKNYWKTREEFVNWAVAIVQGQNAIHAREHTHRRYQITHIHWWDEPASHTSQVPDLTERLAWWIQHPISEIPRAFIWMVSKNGAFADGGGPCGITTYANTAAFFDLPVDVQLLPDFGPSRDYEDRHIVAHEFGHAMGMWHTFDLRPDPPECCGGTCGIPGYGHDAWDVCNPDETTPSLMSYCFCILGSNYTAGPPYATTYYGLRSIRQMWWWQELQCPIFSPAQPTEPCSGPDTDGDSIPDSCDVCPVTKDPMQLDWNENGIGDACEYKKCSFANEQDASWFAAFVIAGVGVALWRAGSRR